MSSGAYSWHDFLEIWTSWSFVWFLFWVKALQRAFDICVAAVRVGEVFPLHKMRTQTYCVIMHFTHLSFFFYTWRKIHCNGPFCLSPCCCCALSLFSSAVLIRRLISRMGHTRARRASCIKHSSSSHHRSPLFLDFCYYGMTLLQHIFTQPFTTLTYFVIESTQVFPIILLQSLAWENSHVKNKDTLKK